MDKEISKDLFEVENPLYQSFEDIQKQYIDKMVIITNRKSGELGEATGGIVRYYGKASKDFYSKWGECVGISEYDPVLLWSFAVRINLLGGFPV